MDKNKDILSVSNSILASGVLIALSIFLTGGSLGSVSLQPQDNQAAAATPTIKVGERADAPKEGRGKVVVYEFSDFQCPYCQQFWVQSYDKIKTEYVDTGKITLIYRHFPLSSIHPLAQKAAEASECANDQGKFWDYHDSLFGDQQLAVTDLKQKAEDLGLDTEKFNTCLDNGDKKSVVQTDLQAGQAAGVTGTPTFFIDGKKYVGALPYDVLSAAIDQAL